MGKPRAETASEPVIAPSRRVKLTFLMMRADGAGGVPRTVVNLANHLVEHFDVRLISIFRKRNRPAYGIDSRVQVQYLIDHRPLNERGHRQRGARNPIDQSTDPPWKERAERLARSSALVPLDAALSDESDRVLTETLATLDPGILVPTRPSLMLIAGRYAPSGVTVVGQDHLTFSVRTGTPEGRRLMIDAIRGLDAFVTLTEGDAHDYRAMVPDADTEITAIPNALSWPLGERATLAGQVVVAAGRLERQKAFGRLVDAYAPVARERPDWRLHIYGFGHESDAIQQRIDDHGVGEQVLLRGYTRDLPTVLSQASIYAMSSIYEGFPMVLLEAMTAGLPMIAYDCPRGPAELIQDGVSGVLVPDGDTAAYTQGLLRMIDDAEFRQSMGLAAWRAAHAYQMPAIVHRWRALFRQLHPPAAG
jgi:glycosyltransferase involved in cell wall biosynthesis